MPSSILSTPHSIHCRTSISARSSIYHFLNCHLNFYISHHHLLATCCPPEVCSLVEACLRNAVLLGEQSKKDDIHVLWEDSNEKKRALLAKAFSHIDSQAWRECLIPKLYKNCPLSTTQGPVRSSNLNHPRPSPYKANMSTGLRTCLWVDRCSSPTTLPPLNHSTCTQMTLREPGQGVEDRVTCFDLLVPAASLFGGR